MDYKYIEQLLERYWECATSLEEEHILHAFFSQKELPEHLERYRALFEYERQQTEVHLSADFDKRMLELVGDTPASDNAQSAAKVVKIGHISLARRLRPLFRAAAAVAIVTLLGTAAQHSFTSHDGDAAAWDYNQQAYKDSYQDPEKAYEVGIRALEMLKEGSQTAVVDSAQLKNNNNAH